MALSQRGPSGTSIEGGDEDEKMVRENTDGNRVVERGWIHHSTNVAWCLLLASLPVHAAPGQLDPLRTFRARQPPPNVLLLVDTSARMQFDPAGDYYDPHTYRRTGAVFEPALGVSSVNTESVYRRRFVRLRHRTGTPGLEADRVVIAGDRDASFSRFDAAARLHVVRSAALAAVSSNRGTVRFGLLTTRHAAFELGEPATEVLSLDPGQQNPTDSATPGIWLAAVARVQEPNGAIETVSPPLVPADAPGANEQIATILRMPPGEPGALAAAGADAADVVDSPLDSMLLDARDEALRLITEGGPDSACRNTVAVLMTGGGEGTTSGMADAARTASAFLDVAGHRVPIYVVAIAPPAEDVPALEAIAKASGGQAIVIAAAEIERAVDSGVVPGAVRALNVAIQHGFADAADVNEHPTDVLPFGTATEHVRASPVLATVNLAGARDATGQILPDTIVVSPLTGGVVPQASNVLVTSGFAVPGEIGSPGFPGRLSAYRAYKPVADTSRPSGYRFVADGTVLWRASIPEPGRRNVFTLTATGAVVPFTAASGSILASYLGVDDPVALIEMVRRQPLGAIIGSTPAVLTPPSVHPPPDADYQAFARQHADRRTLVFVGANDGMLHAFDARLGIEVWALVPFNLLPRLRGLASGQAAGDFLYFVDGSPRLADIKTSKGWRTCLVVGQGGGGSFYQALDVTLPGIEGFIAPDTDDPSALLGYFSLPERVPALWSFPRLQSFDWTIEPYGDIAAGATDLEKAIGDTWSNPLIAQVNGITGRHVVVVGAGLLSRAREVARFGDASAPRGGTTICMLDAESGSVLDFSDVGRDGMAETTDACALGGDCAAMRNGIVADPAGAVRDGAAGITAVYVGDLDGRLWRTAVGASADGSPAMTGAPSLVYDAGPSEPVVASVALTREASSGRFVFLVTGSWNLPLSVGVAPGTLVGLEEAQGGTGIASKFALSLTADATGVVERPAGPPVIGADVVFFATTAWSAEPCGGTSAAVYALTFGGGAAYDSNGDGKVEVDDRRMMLGTRVSASAPFVADRHVYVAVGRGVFVLGDEDGYNASLGRERLRVLSWRDVRR